MTTKHHLTQIKAGVDVTQDNDERDLSISFELASIDMSPTNIKASRQKSNFSQKSDASPPQNTLKSVLRPPKLRLERRSEVHIQNTPSELMDQSPRRAKSVVQDQVSLADVQMENDKKEPKRQASGLDKSSESLGSRGSKRKRKYHQRSDYFVQDTKQDPLRIREYDINFRYKQFLEFFFYHCIFFFLLGPFSFILLYPIAGRTLTKNMGFAGLNFNFAVQTAIWAVLVSSCAFWYFQDPENTDYVETATSTEIYMVATCVLLRICTIASKYGSMHPVRVHLLRRKYLTFDELTQDYMLYKWRAQTDDVIEQELVASIKRHDIDTALFFFNFITTIDEETKKKLTKTRTSVAAMSSKLMAKQFLRAKSISSADKKKESTSRSLQNSGVVIEESFEHSKIIEPQIKEIAESATKSKKQRFFTKKKANLLTVTLDNLEAFDMLSGVNLAREVILEAQTKGIRRILIIAIWAGLIRSLLPMFYRIYEGQYAVGKTSAQIYMCIAFIFCNTYFFTMNLAFVLVGLSDLKRKFYLMTQLSNLLSVRKQEEYQSPKIYPTMNIFDPLSLRAWINLQKIFMDFGRKYFLRINLNLSIFLFFYVIIMVILLLQVFEIMIVIKENLLIYVFLYELVLMFVIIMWTVIIGANINDHFRVHKSIIQKNKTVASDLLQLDDVYFVSSGEEFKASNILYQEGVSKIKFLLKLSGFSRNSQEAANVIQDYLSKLVAFNDNAIEELEFEEDNNPVKILGFMADRELVKEIFVGLFSLGFAVMQKVLNL